MWGTSSRMWWKTWAFMGICVYNSISSSDFLNNTPSDYWTFWQLVLLTKGPWDQNLAFSDWRPVWQLVQLTSRWAPAGVGRRSCTDLTRNFRLVVEVSRISLWLSCLDFPSGAFVYQLVNYKSFVCTVVGCFGRSGKEENRKAQHLAIDEFIQ